MVKYSAIIVIFFYCAAINAQGVDIGYGFRAGMSFAKIDGPSEEGPGGEKLENNKMASGFHIGMSFNFGLTDLMGLRTEFLYSQRGTEYTYEGPSYYLLGRNTLQPLTLNGTRKQTINVSNSYIDIPLLAYYKIGYFEVSGGLNMGVLVGSSAGGSIEFNGISPNGNTVPIAVTLNYNYNGDEAGFASDVLQQIDVDGQNYTVPQFVGAYYDFPTKDKNLYKTFDFGLNLGLAYFLNEGLYLSAKYIHGFGDIDRNEYDISLQNLNTDGSFIQRDDVNKSKSWQFSIGFSF